jgi:FADH2 O2-dependent halogenase
MGFVLDNKNDRYDAVSTEKIWNGLFQKYPSVQQIFDGTQLAAQPGKIIRSKRLQRKLKTCCGSRWVALPHTAGFIDPLFSSGIALTLSGMEKIVGAITQYWKDEQLLHEHLKKYERAFFEELQLTDYLIAGSYHTMPHFELFNAWSMLYFAATIAHEKRRLNNEPPGYFLNADDVAIQNMVHQSFADLLQIIARPSVSENDISRFTKIIKDRIAPYNTAGLLDPSLKNMYQHTAAGIL